MTHAGLLLLAYYTRNKCILDSISVVLSLKYIFPVLFFYVSKILRECFYFYLSKNFSQNFYFYSSKNWAITFYFYLSKTFEYLAEHRRQVWQFNTWCYHYEQ